jgi:hypothetical protein
VLRRFLVALLAVIVTGLALALVAGHGPWAGRELIDISPTHGINEGDVPVLAAWLVGMLACVLLWRRPRG